MEWYKWREGLNGVWGNIGVFKVVWKIGFCKGVKERMVRKGREKLRVIDLKKFILKCEL